MPHVEWKGAEALALTDLAARAAPEDAAAAEAAAKELAEDRTAVVAPEVDDVLASMHGNDPKLAAAAAANSMERRLEPEDASKVWMTHVMATQAPTGGRLLAPSNIKAAMRKLGGLYPSPKVTNLAAWMADDEDKPVVADPAQAAMAMQLHGHHAASVQPMSISKAIDLRTKQLRATIDAQLADHRRRASMHKDVAAAERAAAIKLQVTHWCDEGPMFPTSA